jgi:hypothetical protein
MLPARVISRRGNIEWPARSPDLNTCDIFLWEYLEGKVYEKLPRTTEDLKENFMDEAAAISPIMLQRVVQKFGNDCGNVLTAMDATSKTLYSRSEYCN